MRSVLAEQQALAGIEIEEAKRKAIWHARNNKRHVRGFGEHDVGWWRKKIEKVSWLDAWIEVFVWGADQKQAHQHHRKFKLSEIKAAKKYAKDWVEKGGVLAVLEARASGPGIGGPFGRDEAVIYEYGEYVPEGES